MNYPKYTFTTSTENVTFEFTSNGTNGLVDKAIKYECISKEQNVFNLSFGDKIGINEETGELSIDDLIVTNNGDLEKVLATVASSAYQFGEKYPDRLIYFTGSTKPRTRLYRRAISKEIEEISKSFHIFGSKLINGMHEPLPFDKNGDFDGFIIKYKNDKNEKS